MKSNQSSVTIRRKKGFTVIQNHIIDDLTVSEKALGLYNRIQRWVGYEGNALNGEPFVLTKSFVKSRTTFGTKAFDTAWNELKERGYLKMYFTPPANWEADLLAEPEPDTPHTYYMNASGELKSTNLDRAAKRAEAAKNEEAADQKSEETPEEKGPEYYPPFGSNTSNSNTGDGNINGGNYINTNNNTNNKTIDNNSHPILSCNENMDSMSKEDVDKMRHDVMQQINYIWLCEFFRDMDIDAWVDMMVDVKTTGESTLTGAKLPTALVRDRLDTINQYTMHYIISEFMKNEAPVKNMRNYMIKCLYNGPTTYLPNLANNLKSRYSGYGD